MLPDTIIPDLTTLAPEDTALLATLTGGKRTSTLIRLAAAQAIQSAPTGTKNQVTTTVSDMLGCTMNHAANLAYHFRKSGLTALFPKTARPNRLTPHQV